MDNWQAPSRKGIIITIIVILVIVGIIFLIIALVNSNQSSNGDPPGQNGMGAGDYDDDSDEDGFGGRRNNASLAFRQTKEVERAARRAELASVEEIVIDKECEAKYRYGESQLPETENPSINEMATPDPEDSSEGISVDLKSTMLEDSGKVLKELGMLVDNGSRATDTTNAPAPSDSIPDASDLSPSEIEELHAFEEAERLKSNSTFILDSMNKSVNHAPVAKSDESDAKPRDDTSGLSIDASMTNPASLSSDFSNSTEKSEKKAKKPKSSLRDMAKLINDNKKK